MTNQQKELIAIEVIKTLHRQFEKFPEDFTNNRNAPFHEAFLSAFAHKLEGKVESQDVLISLSSWMHGLNTSLGQSFLEKTAHILCYGNKREFTVSKNNSLRISQIQKNAIADIVTSLTNGHSLPNILIEEQLIYPNNSFEIEATDFTADVYFEDENQIVCLEIKTVKPNKGIFKHEKQKVLEAKAALKNLFPYKAIKYFIGFPFDPQSDSQLGYDKIRYSNYSIGFTKYFAFDEFLLSGEMWNYLSGEENTMETILEIINSIATINFTEEFEFLQGKNNFATEKYNQIISRWFLDTELRIVSNSAQIEQNLLINRRLQRILNAPIFSNSGEYKADRNNLLIN